MARPIHFEIPADDPARAIAFYAEALGWKAQKFDGMDYWLVRTGAEGEPGIDGGIAPRRDPGEPAVNVMGVDSVGAALDRIERAGGTITVPRMAIPGVGWVAYALAFLVALMPGEGGEHYYWEIVLPGSVLGIIVGYATQRYGRTPRPRTA